MKKTVIILVVVGCVSACGPAVAQVQMLSADNYAAKQILGEQKFRTLYLRHVATADPSTFVDVQFQRYDSSARRGVTMAILGSTLVLGGVAAGAGAAVYAVNAQNDCNPNLDGSCYEYSNDGVVTGILTAVSINAGISGLILLGIGIAKARRSGRIRDQLDTLRSQQFQRIRYEGLSLGGRRQSAAITASFTF